MKRIKNKFFDMFQQKAKNDLTENEIFPEQYLKEQTRLYRQDIDRLLEKKDQFVEVTCPACDATDYEKSFEKFTLTYVRCKTCDTVFVNPRPTPQILENFYQNSENYKFWNKYIFPASEKTRREKIARPRAELVRDLCKKHDIDFNILVDVGAGFGTFCEEIKSFNQFKRVVAVEPTPDLAAICRERNIETIEQRIEDVHFNDTINVITNFEVIEHLFAPKEFLQGIASILQPGGIVILTCPNVKGFDIMTLMEASDSVDTEHLNYFHPASLSILFKRCGFEIIDVLTPGKLDAERVRIKVLSGDFDINRHRFLKHILMEQWEELGAEFQKFITSHNLSSNMMLVAKKK